MPLLVTSFPKYQGKLPSKFSFISLEPVNLVIYMIKKAEKGNALIARIYETEGKPTTTARLRTSLSIKSAFLCNLLEVEEESVKVKDQKIEFMVKGREIVTLKLNMREKELSTSHNAICQSTRSLLR